MPSQRYEPVKPLSPFPPGHILTFQVAVADDDDAHGPPSPTSVHPLVQPSSPPPSFKSRASSRRSSTHTARNQTEAEQSLADAFDGPSDDGSDSERDSRPLVDRPTGRPSSDNASPVTVRLDSPPPVPVSQSSSDRRDPSEIRRHFGGGSGETRDGVFANISAKPTRNDEVDEKPPTYEQSQQDPTPPYWETTILTPGGFNSDDVFVDGLLVGSLFSFVWNALISMSFQLIGFLLTYLLHTTHAAKHGSRAGLGITLIQYGFTMRNSPISSQPGGGSSNDGQMPSVPSDPNAHDFDASTVAGEGIPTGGDGATQLGVGSWISYALVICGWLLLIKGTSDFIRARRQEQLIRASPDRGLGVAVVATGEGEHAV